MFVYKRISDISKIIGKLFDQVNGHNPILAIILIGRIKKQTFKIIKPII